MTPTRNRLAAIAVALTGSLAAQTPQRPVFRAAVDVVRLDVSVRDGTRVVTGLTAEQFEVLDSGVAQQIDEVSYGRLPIDVTIAFDVSHSVTGPLLSRLRQSVLDLMRDLDDQDRLRLIVFNTRTLRVVDFTNDVRAVEQALRGVIAYGTTALADALSVALISAPRIDRRQLVVAFTDGADSTSVTDRTMLNEVARRTDATLVMVMPGGVTMTRSVSAAPSSAAGALTSAIEGLRTTTVTSGPAPDQRFFGTLAAETGGSVVPVAANVNLSPVFERILRDFRSSYVLHYTPRGVDRGGYHSVHVRVRDKNYAVTTRRGYVGR